MEILGNLVHPLKSILVTAALPASAGDEDDKWPAHQPGLSVPATHGGGEEEREGEEGEGAGHTCRRQANGRARRRAAGGGRLRWTAAEGRAAERSSGTEQRNGTERNAAVGREGGGERILHAPSWRKAGGGWREENGGRRGECVRGSCLPSLPWGSSGKAGGVTLTHDTAVALSNVLKVEAKW